MTHAAEPDDLGEVLDNVEQEMRSINRKLSIIEAFLGIVSDERVTADAEDSAAHLGLAPVADRGGPRAERRD